MNKKRLSILLILLSSILGLVVVTQVSLSVHAAENQNGGQVATEGIITFYEDSTEPTIESTSTDPTSTSQTESKIVKPIGRYPSTGEMIKGSVGVIGIVLIVLALFLFFKKSKKKQGAEK
ncbi:LPXTG cell wall anchor domain-containing protein [Candidatus Enterococcus mansonii]|uniref:Gram-positive cocci surface proteins LPxTG domain-containing protein n=1 Tax=Candidatus Enterococcus mansonii TaxID=1834181 RepID=A0A242CGQ9_9ENTE|nr:LPXTG cell wall anchor domain-containing protein [Enterococcus sp. 4G2_DIV0659]OTO09349.1 hypothetical protein A5880_000028 [Enterococcus sp. 4G2_DIV0659]